MTLNQTREDREARKAEKQIADTSAAYAGTKKTVIGFASVHTPPVDVKGPSPRV